MPLIRFPAKQVLIRVRRCTNPDKGLAFALPSPCLVDSALL